MVISSSFGRLLPAVDHDWSHCWRGRKDAFEAAEFLDGLLNRGAPF